MQNTTAMPKDALGELIAFLAEHEPLCAVEEKLGDAMTVGEARAALKHLSITLKREAAAEGLRASEVLKDQRISRKTREVLSCLSSVEEKKLLAAFGLTEG